MFRFTSTLYAQSCLSDLTQYLGRLSRDTFFRRPPPHPQTNSRVTSTYPSVDPNHPPPLRPLSWHRSLSIRRTVTPKPNFFIFVMGVVQTTVRLWYSSPVSRERKRFSTKLERDPVTDVHTQFFKAFISHLPQVPRLALWGNERKRKSSTPGNLRVPLGLFCLGQTKDLRIFKHQNGNY